MIELPYVMKKLVILFSRNTHRNFDFLLFWRLYIYIFLYLFFRNEKFVLKVEYETSKDAMALQWMTKKQTIGKKHPYNRI